MSDLKPRLICEGPADEGRAYKRVEMHADLIVVGGGMAGTCCAITAARQGMKTILVQDRPVLGGNASSEIRLWILGATCHMGTNNRWAREGGVMGEIMVENLYRNPEGNPILVDALLLEWCDREDNLTVLLNTAVYDVQKKSTDMIASCMAWNAQNQTQYHLMAPYFCDASGDGVLAFAAGAAFRMGAEAKEEFKEGFAPDEEFGHLLGHTIYFYSKDIGRPVNYVAPDFAMKDWDSIPRLGRVGVETHGCHLWWFEWGGRKDTIHESESIKWELWRVCYGVWDYIKNSGKFPEASSKTLEWVGLIPGKRESRRFEGPHMLTQHDVTDRRRFDDAIAHGGWSIDLHPADGVYAEREGSHHIQLAGVYTTPLRSYYSRNIRNCFIAGRLISASHVAFGTTRVMATGAVGGQGIAMAATQCLTSGKMPAELERSDIQEIQRKLLRSGQWIPGLQLEEEHDLTQDAEMSCSSYLNEIQLPADGPSLQLSQSRAQMLPMRAGKLPAIGFHARSDQQTIVQISIRVSERADEFNPEVVIAQREIELKAGEQVVAPLDFGVTIDQDRYVFVCFHQNESVHVFTTNWRITGMLCLTRSRVLEHSHYGAPDTEFWSPPRRPQGQNIALQLDATIEAYAVSQLSNGYARPAAGANAWVAALEDDSPEVRLKWDSAKTIKSIELAFDADFDHAMESAQFGHPENIVPYVVTDLNIFDEEDNLIEQVKSNHHADVHVHLEKAITTSTLTLRGFKSAGHAPAAMFALRVYGSKA